MAELGRQKESKGRGELILLCNLREEGGLSSLISLTKLIIYHEEESAVRGG